ncbi:MAG: hypothetical protein ABII20_07275 [Candidatus Omnitrophota bacterium]
MEKIVYIVEDKFTQRDYQRFGIELMRKNGFKVEIWDLNSLIYSHLDRAAVREKPVFAGLKTVYQPVQLSEMLSGLSKNDFVMNFVSYYFLTLKIYQELGKSAAHYAVFYANAIPIAAEHQIRNIFRLRKPSAVIKYLLMRLPLWCLKVRPASLILAGGNKCLKYHYPVDKFTEILWIHTLDYDIYLEEKDRAVADSNNMAVFIDEDMTFHPEYAMLKLKVPIEAERYFTLLNRFFELVERETGYEIVIAECPRANYKQDHFKGRKRIKGQTASLIHQSKLVLSHYSTAVNFANLFCKPVIFLTCSDFKNKFEWYQIKEAAGWFGKKPISMDAPKNIDWQFELRADTAQYDNYRRAYIKTENSPQLPFWQVFADRLKKGF